MIKKRIVKGVALGTILFLVGIIGLVTYLVTKAVQMDGMIQKDIEVLKSDTGSGGKFHLNREALAGLPEPVQRYFQYALPQDPPLIKWVAFKSSGKFKLPFSDRRFDVIADEYLSAVKPGLIFDATFKHCPFFGAWVHVRDKYESQQGNMFGNLFSGITIIDEHDVKPLNQDMFLRFIGNLALMPTALLPNAYLRWESVDSQTARLIVADGHNNGVAIVGFNDLGQIISWSTDGRYDKLDGHYREVKQIGRRSNYQEISGFKIPLDFSVEKILKDGTREVFWQGSIFDIHFSKINP